LFAEEAKAARADISVGGAAPTGRRPADCIMEDRNVRESSTAEAGSAVEGMDLGSGEDSGAAVLSFEAALSKASMAVVTVTVESLEVECVAGRSRSEWEGDL